MPKSDKQKVALTKQQLKQLKTLAHSRKPFVMIGQNGITKNVLAELELALNHHELVKVKLAGEDKAARAAMVQELCDSTKAFCVDTIGSIATLYRRNADSPVIKLIV